MVEVAYSRKQAEEPIDLVLMSLKEKVYVKCKFGRELRGKLVVRAYSHGKGLRRAPEPDAERRRGEDHKQRRRPHDQTGNCQGTRPFLTTE